MANENKEEYIQVGFTAMRDPVTREFLPAVPLFIKADDSARAAEQELIKDIAHLFALRMKEYKDKCREAGVGV